MESALGELRGRMCLVYLDNIIVYSTTPSQHLEGLQAVFYKLKEAGLTQPEEMQLL